MTGRDKDKAKGRRAADKGTGSTGKPASKRAGRRPPGAVRRGEASDDQWRTERPARKTPAKSAAGRPQRRGADGSARSSRPATPRRSDARDDKRGSERAERPARSGPARSDHRPWDDAPRGGRPGSAQPWRERKKKTSEGSKDGSVRLNRFLAQSGVCSRRDADDLITAGVVTVNGQVVTELGTKVWPTDKVHYGGQRLNMEKKRYVLLNKPKDFITTTDDPRNRRTVMALVEKACPERIYPVGRLDRHTTGLLLMTNDGDLAKKLTHPSHGAEKIYHVTLDKSVTKAHLVDLLEGVQLDDGPAQADEVNYVDGASKREVGIKIHMGRNRVVRRMFEALGYQVMKLDRVIFAGLTKKDLPRGKWRHLSDKELLFLTKRK